MEPADAAIAKAAALPVAALQHSKDKSIATAAAAVSKNLGIVVSAAELEKEVLDPKADPASRIRSLDALQTAKPDAFSKLLPALLDDRSSYEIRIRAATLLAESNPQAVVDYAAMGIMKSEQIEEQQQAVLLLGKMKEPAAKELLNNYSERFGKGEESRNYLFLEFGEAIPGFSERLPQYTASLTGGDAELGEVIFNEHLAAQCTACHRVGKEGSDVGPPLTEIGKKGREYILESLIDPQAKITPGYGMMTLKTKGGISVSGTLKEENDKSLTLILPDKTEVIIIIAGIESRTKPVSIMPPMGEILTPRQLRDLVAWLAERK